MRSVEFIKELPLEEIFELIKLATLVLLVVVVVVVVLGDELRHILRMVAVLANQSLRNAEYSTKLARLTGLQVLVKVTGVELIVKLAALVLVVVLGDELLQIVRMVAVLAGQSLRNSEYGTKLSRLTGLQVFVKVTEVELLVIKFTAVLVTVVFEVLGVLMCFVRLVTDLCNRFDTFEKESQTKWATFFHIVDKLSAEEFLQLLSCC